MKVCHLMSGDLWAGAEVQAYTMIKSLNQSGDIELSAVCLNQGVLASRLKELGLTVDILDESKLSFSEIFSSLKEICRVNTPDLIHSHRLKENVLAALIKRAGLVSGLVSSVHGLPEATGIKNRIKSRALRTMETTAIKRYFDRVLPVSKDIAGKLISIYGPALVTEIHNAIDPEESRPVRSSEEVRETLGLKPDQIVIGSVGRMVPVKGYDRFIRTARLIVDVIPDAKFVLAGEGLLLEELKQLTTDLNLDDAVIFTGFRTDIADLVNCMDLFLITSHHEGIPMTVLEAMSMGKVVVSYKIGGLGEIIEHGKSGWLLDVHTAEAMAQACTQILSDLQLRKIISVEAKVTIINKFSTATQRERLHKIYESIVASQGPK